ncbi:MAG TPA: universal stress protein [Longimicrobiales bacterium]|nr:universal stress protein [Longimicrobiales bacterium]
MWFDTKHQSGGGTVVADVRSTGGRRSFARIMVPLDGSAAAEGALPVALRIARASEGNVHLVWVRPEHRRDTDTAQREIPIRQRYLEGVAEEVGDRLGAPASRKVLAGHAAEALCAHAIERDVDLVVMGSRGAGGLWRLGLGSTTKKLVRRLPMPLIVVRTEDEHEASLDGEVALSRIVVPLDGSEEAEAVLGPAGELAHLLGGSLTLLRVLAFPMVSAAVYGQHARGFTRETARQETSDAEDYLDLVASRLRATGLSASTAVRESDSAGSGILRYLREVDADLIAITATGRGSSSRLGGTASRVLQNAAGPLLVCGPAVV